jgi:hypothetical protein
MNAVWGGLVRDMRELKKYVGKLDVELRKLDVELRKLKRQADLKASLKGGLSCIFLIAGGQALVGAGGGGGSNEHDLTPAGGALLLPDVALRTLQGPEVLCHNQNPPLANMLLHRYFCSDVRRPHCCHSARSRRRAGGDQSPTVRTRF